MQTGLMKTHLRRVSHDIWRLFRDVSPKTRKLHWQAKEKQDDKGVIIMRMMETYMGEEDDKYVPKMVNSKVNE